MLSSIELEGFQGANDRTRIDLAPLPGRGTGLNRWTDGLGAWDAILADRHDLLQRVNAALRRIGAGYRLTMQELFDPTASAEALSATHTEATARRLLVDMGARLSVLPCEAGVGVSQLVPVVVAAPISVSVVPALPFCASASPRLGVKIWVSRRRQEMRGPPRGSVAGRVTMARVRAQGPTRRRS